MHKEDQIAETETSERSILEELEVLDKKIVRQQQKLSELETKMEKQQTLINKEENTLNKIRGEKGMVEDHLQKRIAAYYTMGDIGLLNVTFSTQTLPELLTFHDAFDVLIKYDQDVIKVYRETIKEMERAKSALDLEKSILQEFHNQEFAEKAILENTKAEKHILLTQVRTQSKLHKQAIDEMQQASDDLTRSIVAIKSKNQIDDQRFLTGKGNLRPPVDGELVTLFQQEKVNKLGISRKSQGIELQAPDGTNIVAVGDGEVIFSGYLRGYGNTVIIHHGFQYYTVTSRIETILVTKGHIIKKEDTIGIMGGTATLFDDGIYFEIRHGNQSLDPLLWLNPNRLRTSHEHSGELPNKGNSAK
ncbi:MAG: peptidoglycan DD-metalloendopeptidase family protein [Proteobacteria bacterium]|nr:peptidoglycan DD-metalloendopeptidase family protein [Pseudomonadota bacterium]